MRRSAWLVVVPMFAVFVAMPGSSEPIEGRKSVDVTVPPQSVQTFVVRFQPHHLANVITVGDGKAPLGLYIFDRHGNCICHDDRGGGGVGDDNAVAWYPSSDEPYFVEIANLGVKENKCDVTFR